MSIDNRNDIDLLALRTFCKPHSGRARDGAAVALPRAVKVMIDGLDGTTTSVQVAINVISFVVGHPADFTVGYDARTKEGYILMLLGRSGGTQHMWKLISFT